MALRTYRNTFECDSGPYGTHTGYFGFGKILPKFYQAEFRGWRRSQDHYRYCFRDVITLYTHTVTLLSDAGQDVVVWRLWGLAKIYQLFTKILPGKVWGL